MIVLNRLLVTDTKSIETEDGPVELPGGLYAEFSVHEQENVLVSINDSTYNSLMSLILDDAGTEAETLEMSEPLGEQDDEPRQS